MFRRRRIYRGGDVPHPYGNLPQQALRRAHRLLDQENYQDAAVIFETIAQGAQEEGFLGRAPFLYLQAARARLLAGHVDAGMVWLKQGFDLLADTRRFQALQRTGQRAVQELNRLGQTQQAQEAESWLVHLLEATPAPWSGQSVEPKATPTLPAKCPQCGATVRPDEVEWIDKKTPGCAYCGSILKNK